MRATELLQVEIYGLLEGIEHVLGTISKIAGNIPATVRKSSAKLYPQ